MPEQAWITSDGQRAPFVFLAGIPTRAVVFPRPGPSALVILVPHAATVSRKASKALWEYELA